MHSPNLPEMIFANANEQWNLDQIYGDLENIKQNSLSATERSCLRGLLLGIDPSAIAEKLHRQPQGLRVDLSRGLYQYIKELAQQPVKNWREVPMIMERLGYKYTFASPLTELSTSVAANNGSVNSLLEQSPIQNLPIRDFSAMIGREREIEQLQALLSYDCPVHCISIEGTGGIGKTALALSVAYRYFHAADSPFDALIFTSAKQQRLTAQGILPRLKPNPHRNLQDILRSIARTLQQPNLPLVLDEQIEHIQALLSRQRTLLIVDNLESVEDYQTILAFLYDLPATVKIIITSRQQAPFESIRLEPLSEAAGMGLIQQQAEMKRIVLTPAEIKRLYQQTSGIPAAIVYAMGQLAAGYPLSQISDRLTQTQGNYARFYFESSVLPLRGGVAHRLLMALSLFSQSAAEDAIVYVAGADATQTREAFVELQRRSLIWQCNQQHNQRYDMLSLTRELTVAELTASDGFEAQTRERWIEWYLDFSRNYRDQDWREWQDYQDLEQEWNNLQDVIEWCIEQNQYQEVKQFWQSVKGYTHIQGYRSDRRTCWDIRLDWADWLLHTAEQRQDWATALEIMLDQGWTLMLMGQPQNLEQSSLLYHRAWNLREHRDLVFQIDLIIQIAALQVERQQFETAMQWLIEARTQLAAQTIQPTNQRQQIQLDYYEGKISYKTGDYSRAQMQFQRVLEQAEVVQWQRAIFLAKSWLADIAIQQRNLEEAESVFQEGLQAAEVNRDECRAAFCKRSLARLEQARGNEATARQWAEAAKQGFERVGMLTEMQETIELLQALTI